MGDILIPRRSNGKNFHLLNNCLFGVLECQLIKEGVISNKETVRGFISPTQTNQFNVMYHLKLQYSHL